MASALLSLAPSAGAQLRTEAAGRGAVAPGPRRTSARGTPASGRGARAAALGGPLAAHSAVNAAALQDHLVRSMNLGSVVAASRGAVGRRRPTPEEAPKAVRRSAASAKVVSRFEAPRKPRWKPEEADASYALSWQCEACGALSDAALRSCSKCTAARPETRSLLAPKPSLAEARGLVPAPAARLTNEKWDELELQARQRGAASEPCPVCLEALGMREQALLSCGHLFHRACIDSFERFQAAQGASHGRRAGQSRARVLANRKCPLCRAPGYEKRRTRIGAEAHVHGRVTVLQAAWRRFRVRRAFLKQRRAFYDSGGGAGSLARRAYFAREMQVVSERIRGAVARSEARSAARVERLLVESEAARQAMRRAMLAAGLEPAADAGASDDEEGDAAASPGKAEAWAAASAAAESRVSPDDDCPICLQPLVRRRAEGAEPDASASEGAGTSLLSCGHAMHSACVRSFERFQVAAGKQRACPVCRHPDYKRREWRPGTVAAPPAPKPLAAPAGGPAKPSAVAWLQDEPESAGAHGVPAEAPAPPAPAGGELSLQAALDARQARNRSLADMLARLTSNLDRLGGE